MLRAAACAHPGERLGAPHPAADGAGRSAAAAVCLPKASPPACAPAAVGKRWIVSAHGGGIFAIITLGTDGRNPKGLNLASTLTSRSSEILPQFSIGERHVSGGAHPRIVQIGRSCADACLVGARVPRARGRAGRATLPKYATFRSFCTIRGCARFLRRTTSWLAVGRRTWYHTRRDFRIEGIEWSTE